jgi:hypothetical protein
VEASCSPFPLVQTLKAAHNHAKKLKKCFIDPQAVPLGKCQQVLAELYGFGKWDFFTSALKRFQQESEDSRKVAFQRVQYSMFNDFSEHARWHLADPQEVWDEAQQQKKVLAYLSDLEAAYIDVGDIPSPEWEPDYQANYDEVFELGEEKWIWENFLTDLVGCDSLIWEPPESKRHLTDDVLCYEKDRCFTSLVCDPTEEKLREWPQLEAHPNMLQIIAVGEWRRRYTKAESKKIAMKSKIVLQHFTTFEIDGELLPVEVNCCFSWALDEFPIGEIAHQCWEYSAQIILRNPKKDQNPILALSHGNYIVPFLNNTVSQDSEFFYTLDAQSAHLNVIAKVILNEVLPSLEVNDLFEWANKEGNCTGVLCPYIEIHPEFRKKGLLDPILNCMIVTIARSNAGTLVTHSLPCPEKFMDKQNEQWLGEPAALLFEVDGSRQGQLSTPFEPYADLVAEMNVNYGKKEFVGEWDVEAEKRKSKLTKHFNDLYIDYSYVHIEVYDPEEYPTS